MRRAPAAIALSCLLSAVPAPAFTTAEAGSTPATPRTATQVDIPPPTLDWGPCPFVEAPAECASVDLPLDYDDPTGPTTPIGVLRVPASGQRIGTLFVNPGGPGGPSTEFAPFAGRLIGPGVARRFDVVGIDPRGVGSSGWAFCRVPDLANVDLPSFPITARQTRQRIRIDRGINAGCAERRSVIVDHDSTADVARDMDVIRQALGEEQLSYYGISYGSLLGQTYAAMFPDRVRAMIVDGVLDPLEWTRGDASLPMTYRLGSGRGAYEALTSALVECDRVGRERCPVAGHANESWRRVLRAARAGHLKLGRDTVTPQELIDDVLGALYSADEIRFIVEFLAAAEQMLDGTGSSDLPEGRAGSRAADEAWAELERIRAQRDAVGPYGYDYGVPRRPRRTSRVDVLFPSVLCGDSQNPGRPFTWASTSRMADRTQPWFGRSWTWASSLCADWPGQAGSDAFRGPWQTGIETAYPLLIVGNAHDPATPIRGARTANRLFADSVLLMLNGWGHGAIATSRCISNRMATYLIQRTLPPPSTVCRSDIRPFSGDPRSD